MTALSHCLTNLIDHRHFLSLQKRQEMKVVNTHLFYSHYSHNDYVTLYHHYYTVFNTIYHSFNKVINKYSFCYLGYAIQN